jgi:beta-lactamase superfamily II metal-dependent hydrolase
MNYPTNIEPGKTYLEAMRRWYPVHGVARLDALVLTHGHADAVSTHF